MNHFNTTIITLRHDLANTLIEVRYNFRRFKSKINAYHGEGFILKHT